MMRFHSLGRGYKGINLSQELSSALDLVETAWGDKQGYVCLSVKDPKTDEWQDKMCEWPAERERVAEVIKAAASSSKDLYWSPMVYDRPRRIKHAATDTDLLWSDLDEADPRKLPEHLKPTAWWETSPGRFQALWVTNGKPMSPKTQQMLNQKLTYAIGADKGTWNLTRVLRLPGLPNHKYKDVRVSKAHVNGRAPNPIELTLALDHIKLSGGGETLETPLATATLPSPESVFKKKRRQISGRAKQMLNAREPSGDRSERLWELECLLAESGLSEAEIASLVRRSAWNKFRDRHDEVEILLREARKAVNHVGDNARRTRRNTDNGTELKLVDDVVLDEDDSDPEPDVEPLTWGEFDRQRKPIKWLVAGVWGASEVGFISGLPKSYKSWLALDFAVSVATGTRFLNSFQSFKENVLLIQEEDPKVVMQDRLGHIAGAKGLIGAKQVGTDAIEIHYDLPSSLKIVSNSGFSITEEYWQDLLVEWIVKDDIRLVILDPLSMIANVTDEFKLFGMMNEVFKPLKRIRAETGSAICVVHHHVKSNEKSGASAMYGSVAGWAWEESALHLQIPAPGKILAERFSKHSRLNALNIEIGDIEEEGWKPHVYEGSISPTTVLDLVQTYESGISVNEICEMTTLGRDAVQRQLRKLQDEGKVQSFAAPREEGQKGRRKMLWRGKS